MYYRYTIIISKFIESNKGMDIYRNYTIETIAKSKEIARKNVNHHLEDKDKVAEIYIKSILTI